MEDHLCISIKNDEDNNHFWYKVTGLSSPSNNLILKEGYDKIDNFPFCLSYREAEEFYDRLPKPTEATIEVTTTKQNQPDFHGEELTYFSIFYIYIYIYIIV